MYIETLFWTIAFCLGFHLVTRDDYALSFIRKFFDRIDARIELIKQNELCFHTKPPKIYALYTILSFVSIPLVQCITCMGSIWGVLWFSIIHGFSLIEIPHMILNCFAASFIQTFIWKYYVKNLI